jgi:hypothetical protein
MASRMRRPETVRLEISQGDWIMVKKHLTAGEARHIFARMIRRQEYGRRAEMEPEMAGLSQVVGYLLDWSLTDPDGKVIRVRDQDEAAIQAALLSIDPEAFQEIQAAVDAHDERMRAEREAEKNGQGGESTSSATSASAA